MANPRWLTLDDILDQRAYERERPERLRRVIELKRKRRVAIGDLVSVVFENRETVAFQVQEMVRAERIIRDEDVAFELETYNPLIPAPGELSATMFLELTTEEALRRWLPALVGIERSVSLVLGQDGEEEVRAELEAGHAAQLTREEVTASVHYLRWNLRNHLERFRTEPVRVRISHPRYSAEALLGEETKLELLADLEG